MRHKTTQQVFSYFNRIRNGGAVPLRADLDPAALKTVLPDLFILEMARNGAIRFRLAGTRLCSVLGREMRSENFGLLWTPADRHRMKLAAEAVLANQAPLRANVRAFDSDGEEDGGEFEMLLLPLASSPGVCDRLFGSLAEFSVPKFRSEQPRFLEATQIEFRAGDHTRERTMAAAAEADAFAATQVSSMRGSGMRLRLLQGGRRD